MQKGVKTMIDYISNAMIPLIVIVVLYYGNRRKLPVYDIFTDGVTDGLKTVLQVFPYLLAMNVCIGALRGSGLIEFISDKIGFILTPLHLEAPILMLALMRPLSGSAATAVLTDIFKTYHPDSLMGLTASAMMGSTETTFYVTSLYFGSIGIKNYRYCLKSALIADFIGMSSAIIISLLLF